MAEARTIARPYAEAVFRLAKAKDELARLVGYAATRCGNRRGRAAFARLSVIRKYHPDDWASCFSSICGDRLNDEGRNFILLLAENGRIEILPEVSELFEQLKTQHEGVLGAKIISAFAMSDAQLRESGG